MSDYDLDSGPDPATYAAAAAEGDMDAVDSPVYAVGIGPGNLEYLTPRGRPGASPTWWSAFRPSSTLSPISPTPNY